MTTQPWIRVGAPTAALVALMSLLVAGWQPRALAQPPGGTAAGEWNVWGGDLASSRYSPLSQIDADQLRQAPGRLALEGRQLRSRAGPHLSRHAALRERQALQRGRPPAHGRLHRPGHRRDAVDVPREGQSALGRLHAQELRQGRGLRARRRPSGHLHGEPRLVSPRARRRHRASRCRSSATTASSICTWAWAPTRSIPTAACSTGATSRRRRRRLSSTACSSSATRTTAATTPRTARTSRASSAATTPGPAGCCGASIRCRRPASRSTTPGRTTRGSTRATCRRGRRSRPTPTLGLVYVGTDTPTNDYYGGSRHGANAFGTSLLALDVKTGARKWHFQFVHHDIWNMDLPDAPHLLDITVDGTRIPAIAQATKQGWVYVFNRETGEPVWPIEERPVPPPTCPVRRPGPRSRFVTMPPPFAHPGLHRERHGRLHAGAARRGRRECEAVPQGAALHAALARERCPTARSAPSWCRGPTAAPTFRAARPSIPKPAGCTWPRSTAIPRSSR